jgi:hypothetical protein
MACCTSRWVVNSGAKGLIYLTTLESKILSQFSRMFMNVMCKVDGKVANDGRINGRE